MVLTQTTHLPTLELWGRVGEEVHLHMNIHTHTPPGSWDRLWVPPKTCQSCCISDLVVFEVHCCLALLVK